MVRQHRAELAPDALVGVGHQGLGADVVQAFADGAGADVAALPVEPPARALG